MKENNETVLNRVNSYVRIINKADIKQVIA